METPKTRKKAAPKKSAHTKENPMPLREELPDEVTVTFKLNKGKYMHLRQYLGSGEIEGHKLEATYSVGTGACIIQIGKYVYEGDLREMIQAVFDQIVKPS